MRRTGAVRSWGIFLAIAAVLCWSAQALSAPLEDILATAAKRIKPSDLKAAAARQAAAIAAARNRAQAARAADAAAVGKQDAPFAAAPMALPPIGPGDLPDYFSTPNWANSPPLHKFLDPLPGLWDPRGGGVAPAKCIPLAVPDIVTYPGSDYYEIELRQYQEKMHTELNPTTLRGYVQISNGTDTSVCGGVSQPACTPANNTVVPAPIRYLGPLIIAQKDRPVRIKFTNNLPTGDPGKLFVPVDTTIMGSGPFEIDYDPVTKQPTALFSGNFKENRATLHLHGGRTPWISDGTPHQWITPALEPANTYPQGVSLQDVPDMPDPGPGAQTFYWTNQQSARLMFYHDHAWGITRLNVYVGEAAGYMIQDPAEHALIYDPVDNPGGVIPADQIPLIIQDKTFVDPATIVNTDPTWAWGSQPWTGVAGDPMTPVQGDLWWPHVYMPAQNPYNPDMSGINAMGRWHYGPWFWPPTPLCGTSPKAVPPWCVTHVAVPNPYYEPACDPAVSGFCQPPEIPGVPTVSWGAEAFLDTPLVNGMVYPTVTIDPKAYRFRVLNAAHDRFLNLQLYKASPIIGSITVTDPGSGYDFNNPPAVTISGGGGTGASADAVVSFGFITGATVDSGGSGYTTATVTITGDGAGATATATITDGAITGITIVNSGSGYTTAAIAITGDGFGAAATATIDPTGIVSEIVLTTVGSGYTTPPTVTVSAPGGAGTTATATATVYSAPTEVGMVPAAKTVGFPANWPADGREGGVPDPATSGPAWIQIGTEGGFLPAPALLPNHPVAWNLDPTMFNVGNVLSQADGGGTLFLGPAERADVIVDFSNYAGQTLILYNDAPTAFPALDPHYDYYTGAPDRTDMGGAPPVLPGMGPNVRTIMQIVVTGTGGTAPANDYNPTTLANLQTAFRSTGTPGNPDYVPGVFASSQDPIVVGQRAYNSTYSTTFPATWPNWGVSRISDTSISFRSVFADGTISDPLTIPMKPKAIHDEMGGTFDDYGRMSAKLGLTVPAATAANNTFVLQNYVDPPTERLAEMLNNGQPEDGVQIWKISHNGVDTHPIHFHLFDVQVINRVGWDGFIRLPDPNELGWKDTVRMAPLEDTIVALRPVKPTQPFGLPNSVRPLNPLAPLGSEMGFSQIDPLSGNALVPHTTNQFFDFGWEYVWHCHILSHEENDMMRSITFAASSVLPAAPVLSGSATPTPSAVLTWTDPTPVGIDPAVPGNLGNPANEIGFRIERCSGPSCTNFAPYATALANQTTFTAVAGAYGYRIVAFNAQGDSAPSNTFQAASGGTLTANPASPRVAGTAITFTAAPTGGDPTGPYEYRFYWRPSASTTWTLGRAYATGNTWIWDTAALGLVPGTYVISVNIRHVGSTVSQEASRNASFTINAVPPATGVTLAPVPTSPRPAGTSITFTAGATGGDAGPYEYLFGYRLTSSPTWIWQPAYGGASWIWDTSALGLGPGTYSIQVYVRHVGATIAFEASRTVSFNLTAAFPATGVTLAPTPASPRPVGTSITFDAGATGGDAGPYEYRFGYRLSASPTWIWQPAYSAATSWIWDTGALGLVLGAYSIQVQVRHVGSPVTFEASRTVTFNLTAASPATGVTLVAAPTSPRPIHTQVIFTAAATGGDAGPYEYRFFWRPSGSPTWTVGQAYSTVDHWNWHTEILGLPAGSYVISAQVRHVGSPAGFEAERQMGYTLQ